MDNKLLNITNEDLFSFFLDTVDFNYSVIDPNGNYLIQNNRMIDSISGGAVQAADIDPPSWEHCKEVMRLGKKVMKEEPYKGRFYLSIKQPLFDGDRCVGIRVLSFDITDRKRAEEYRIKQEAAQKAAEFARLMAGAVAHELRTPLNTIHSAAQGIAQQLPQLIEAYELASSQDLPVAKIRPWRIELLKKATQTIARETYFSSSIIDMLLMNIKDLIIDPNTFVICSATNCVQEALARYPFTDEEKKLVSFLGSPDFEFKGDVLLLVHALFNLIKNALYYIAKAQQGNIIIRLEQGDKENKLHFKDTGLGIPQDILPHIFEQFFTKTHGGTGVGLSFCKAVMQGFGGDITCTSQQNEFTEFTLIFPKA